ncbi:MAG: glycogen debranching protein [Anaerolineae bacterium]|nr:glycogen debranching protein [Anaerolineae bacterium]
MLTNTLGRAECGNFDTAANKEWLVTNGLGGYAAGTISGANTRRYHGVLVAALHPPVERTVLVAKVDGTATYADKIYPLFANEFTDGAIDPHGYRYLESFHLEGLIPVWGYALADARLEQRVWMAHGHNTAYVTFTLTRATDPLTLTLIPLCTYRDYHSHSRGGWSPAIVSVPGGFEVNAFPNAQPYRVITEQGEFEPDPNWYWNFKHRVESYRGLDDTEDLLAAGRFKATLQPGQTLTLICSTEPIAPHNGEEALKQERQRQADLLERPPADQPNWIQHLTLAADQFIVQRSIKEDAPSDITTGVTVIAGYPWFGDWGRDTMIALPGLTLTTGRPEVAATILRTFARYISQGMLPNRFPDAGETPEYNTVDATLWYFQAVYQHLRYTHKLNLVKELYPSLVDIIRWHQGGTRYNIRVDPDDGLLFAGEPDVQLTWMDAKVGGWVVTPRIGKPVEVNALWYNALRIMAELSKRLRKSKAAREYNSQADTVAESFRRRFWFQQGGYLYDVIDGPEGDMGPDGRRYDASLRPNQIFAVSLPFSLLNGMQAKAVVDRCARHLWTSYGLRSLTDHHPMYTGHYGGGQRQRDSAYHQGTVWAWLLGPFAIAHYQVYGDAVLARAFLTPIKDHLTDACFGSISEIFDGDPPHASRGCFAQAWSVAEVLWAWQQIGP